MSVLLSAKPTSAKPVPPATTRASIMRGLLVGLAPFTIFWTLAAVDDVSRVVGATTLFLCAATCGALTKTARSHVAVVWGATAIGIAIQLRLDAQLGSLLAFSVASATAFCGAYVLPRLLGRRLRTANLTLTGQTLLGLALLLRIVPGLQGHLNSGQLTLGALSIQLGEFSRILLIVGVGLVAWNALGYAGLRRLHGAEFKAFLVGAALLLGNLALLAVVDTGPAIIAAAAAGIMVIISIARIRPFLRKTQLWLTAGVLAFLAGAFVAQFDVVNRLESRWSHVSTPDEQLAAALRAAQGGGFIGHGVGSSPLASHIPVATSDFVPSVIAADLGYLALGIATAVLLWCFGDMLKKAGRGGFPLAIVAAGMLTALLAQTAMTVLGSTGAIPLTGLSTPALAANGSTMVSTFMALGVAAAALDRCSGIAPHSRSDRSKGVFDPPVGVVGLSAGLVAYLCALAVLPINTDLQGLYLPRGEIRTSDGEVIATTGANGTRVYPSGSLYADIGYARPGYADYGLESMYRHELTCGGSPSVTDVVLQLFRPPACVRADLETTLQASLQKTARDAAGDDSAQVVVSDSSNGNILALYSSQQSDPALLERGSVPEAPSRLRDSPPGSTFKLVVAAAALLNDTDPRPAPTDVMSVDGAELTNSGHFNCPDTSITTMLAFSCNTTAGFLALRLGQTELNRVAEEYFGANTWTRYDGGDVAPLSLSQPGKTLSAAQLMRTGIGQESVRSTPLAMNAATAVIARSAQGGTDTKIPSLHLVSAVCAAREDNSQDGVTQGVGKVLPGSVAQELLRGMQQAAKVGTASELGQTARHLGRDVAAKSGTAEVNNPGKPGLVDSWITAIVDGRWIITARVQNSTPEQANKATRIAESILPLVPKGNIPNKSLCS